MMSGAGTDRTTLQDRLGSLFGSEPSPRSSLGDHSRPASPRKQNTKLQNGDTGEETGSTMSRSSSVVRQIPIVRWLGTPAPNTNSPAAAEPSAHRRTPSDSVTGASLRPSISLSAPRGRRSEEIPVRRSFTSQQGANSDSREHSDALQQAISDEVFKIKRPPEARMAAHHRDDAHNREFRHPTLLDKPNRASFPTSSLSKPLAPVQTNLSPQPSIVTSPTSYSRPGLGLGMAASGLLGMGGGSTGSTSRTSLDSLRSLTARDRGIQTSAAQAMSPVPSGLNRWWFQDGNKETVDGMLHDADKAPTAQQEAEAIRKKYLTPRNPLVFCHGLLGFDSVNLGVNFAPLQITHWRGIKEVLEESGVEVLITKVPATSGVDARAKVLEATIAEKFPGRSVHLIGHSMGGLDCRYLASKIRPTAFKILSVTTIATPHHGSYFADYFIDTLGKARIPALVSFLEYLPNGGGDGKAFEGLTMESMKKFNEEVTNVEDVQYFSWGAKCSPGLVDAFRWPHGVIQDKEGPNDGLVSVSSAQWGKYLGTLEDVNHLDLVGWVNTARYKWAELMGKGIKFKPASFYLEVAAKLAEEVEGLRHDDDSSDEETEVLFSAGGSLDDQGPPLKRKKSSKHSDKVKPDALPAPPGTVGGGVD